MDDDECLCGGPGWLHPCDNCGKHSNLLGKPSWKQRVTRYLCPFCYEEMTRPFADVHVSDVVKVDVNDDDVTFGEVMKIDDRRVLVAADEEPEWFEVWQLQVW